MATPVEIAIALTKQGDGATRAADELQLANDAANALADSALAGERAQQKWNRSLEQLSTEGLQRLEAQLAQVVAETGKAGGSTAALQQRLVEVRAQITATGEASKRATEEVGRFAQSADNAGSRLNRAQREMAATTRGARGTAQATVNAAEAFEKLNSAAQGGVSGILGIRQALTGLTSAFRASPILAGISVFLLLKDYAADAGRALGDLIVRARETGEGFGLLRVRGDAVRQNLAEIKREGDVALEGIARQAKAAADDIERFATGIDEAQRRLDALADAATKAKLAELDLAEAQALASAPPEERDAIRARFAGERNVVRRDAESASIARAQGFERERAEKAQETVRAAQREIDRQNAAVGSAERRLAELQQRGRTQRADSPEGADTLAQIRLVREELEQAKAALIQARGQYGPVLDRARGEYGASQTAQRVLAERERANDATARAEDTRSAIEQRDRLAEKVARDAARRIRQPGDLNAEQEEALVRRGLELNRNALAQEGRQAGETIGDALGLALKEIFPTVTDALLKNLQAKVDGAFKAEAARLQAQLDALRN